jgi:hypothetical protein
MCPPFLAIEKFQLPSDIAHYKMAIEFFCLLKGVEAYAIILGFLFNPLLSFLANRRISVTI